jgi:hypothetical protein
MLFAALFPPRVRKPFGLPGPTCLLAADRPDLFCRGTTDISRASAHSHARALESRCVQGRPLGFWAWPAGDPCPSRVSTDRCCRELCLLQGCGHRIGALRADRTDVITGLVCPSHRFPATASGANPLMGFSSATPSLVCRIRCGSGHRGGATRPAARLPTSLQRFDETDALPIRRALPESRLRTGSLSEVSHRPGQMRSDVTVRRGARSI